MRRTHREYAEGCIVWLSYLAVAVAILWICRWVSADEPLPVVEEEVDEIVVVCVEGNQFRRVVFLRDGQVLAHRLLTRDMLWTSDGNKVLLIWQDHSIAERIVSADRFAVVVLDHDPTQVGRCGPWWAMFRNMRDLKQP